MSQETAWLAPSRAQKNVEAAREAQAFSIGFCTGRAGAIGWPAKTNLIAHPHWRQSILPVGLTQIQGRTIRPFATFVSPTVRKGPMRASDVAKVYESQLAQIQDYLLGTP